MQRRYLFFLPHLCRIVLASPIVKSAVGEFPHLLAKRDGGHDATFIVQAVLIPVLVILSGIFAGLTLGYMSLDETQLEVLAISGTPKQQEYAKKIQPIRKNGHLLLTTLLLANMIVNETLPVVSENVLGGGIQAVVASTVLIVVFSEIIPQSLCSRFGLQIGAYMAVPTRLLIYLLFIVAWPIAKVLEFVLGPHQGIVYRRNELKELINLHSTGKHHGGDLKEDTVAFVGGALDFQEKVVKDAMTPLEEVFMLPITAKLDYETLAKVVKSGHSRIPVFEEVKVGKKMEKKITGVLLVKQCVLLDPEDATPLDTIPLNKLPVVPYDEPLLGILDRFQQGHSHMAIVSRIPRKQESKDEQGSLDEDVKVSLTQRFLNKIGVHHDHDHDHSHEKGAEASDTTEDASTVGEVKEKEGGLGLEGATKTPKTWGLNLEQTMPSDAILSEEGVQDFLRAFQVPLGIITLEDVLEELIGEDILDEFDLTGAQALPSALFVPEEAQRAVEAANARDAACARHPPPLPVGTNRLPRVQQGLNAWRKTKAKRANSLPSSPVSGGPDDGNILGFGEGPEPGLIPNITLSKPAPKPLIQKPLPTQQQPAKVAQSGPIPVPGTPKKGAFKSLMNPEAGIPLPKKKDDGLKPLKDGGGTPGGETPGGSSSK